MCEYMYMFNRAWQTALHEARSARMSSPPTLTYGTNVTYVVPVHRPAPVVGK